MHGTQRLGYVLPFLPQILSLSDSLPSPSDSLTLFTKHDRTPSPPPSSPHLFPPSIHVHQLFGDHFLWTIITFMIPSPLFHHSRRSSFYYHHFRSTKATLFSLFARSRLLSFWDLDRSLQNRMLRMTSSPEVFVGELSFKSSRKKEFWMEVRMRIEDGKSCPLGNNSIMLLSKWRHLVLFLACKLAVIIISKQLLIEWGMRWCDFQTQEKFCSLQLSSILNSFPVLILFPDRLHFRSIHSIFVWCVPGNNRWLKEIRERKNEGERWEETVREEKEGES